jgi:hypothetical protein
MKSYTITVNGNVYDVTVEENGAAASAPAAAPKAAPAAAPAVSAPAPAPVVEEVPETDDLELVAVITAAIAAGGQAPADGFVVRSIRRRGRKSNWRA